MKKTVIFVLLLALCCPLFTLHSSGDVYSGKALDVDYILADKDIQFEQPDMEMTDEEYDAWVKEQEELIKETTAAAGAALSIAPDYRIQYEANTETGVLRIFCDQLEEKGGQKMLSYAKAAWIPWNRFNIRRHITSAVVEEGVLTVGHYSFWQNAGLKTVYLPHSLQRMDQGVFYMCSNLETIYYAGTEADFRSRVVWNDVQNNLDAEGNIPALSKVHFGEHVTVQCRNDEGHIFSTYTVGGYQVGDAYTVSAKNFGGLTLVGTGEFSGKFKKNDDTVYTFTYHCDHKYEIADPEKPCGNYCSFCGAANPEGEAHTWYSQEISRRGFATEEEILHTCTVCGAEKLDTKPAYFWYVLAIGGGVLILAGASAAVVIPVRRRKKLKELTW